MFNRIFYIGIILSSFLFGQNDLNNRFMLASSYEQAGEFEKAKNILEDIYKRQPENFQFFDALNRMYVQLKNYDASVKIIQDRISLSPADPNLYGLLGKTLYLKGDETGAFSAWDQGIEKSGGNYSVYRVMANYAIDRRAFSKAIEILSKGKEKSPDARYFAFDLANLYAATMNFTKAAEEYLSLLKSQPNQVIDVQTRLSPYISKPEALQQTIKVFEESSDNSNQVRSILAWLYTENRNFDGAYKIYSSLDNERGSNGADLYNFGQMLYTREEYEASSKVFLDIINNHSSSPLINAARLGFAKSTEEILNSGPTGNDYWKPVKKSGSRNSVDADKLVSIYMDLSKVRVNSGNIEISAEAAYRAAGIYLHYQGNTDKAEEIYKKITEDYPLSSYAALSAVQLGSIYLKKGDYDKSLGFLQQGMSLPRITEEQKNKARLMTARIYFFRKDFEGSKRKLNEILTNLKDNSANDAIELSLLLNPKMNDSTSLVTFADAESLIEQEKFDDALKKLEGISADKGGFMLGNLVSLREAEVELALDHTDKAVSLLEKIGADESRNIYADKALYLLGNIYDFSLNNAQKAVEIYEKLLAKFPSSMYLDEARERIINLRNKLS